MQSDILCSGIQHRTAARRYLHQHVHRRSRRNPGLLHLHVSDGLEAIRSQMDRMHWTDCVRSFQLSLHSDVVVRSVHIFKPPPPIGAGGGYMFSGRPSVPLSVRPSVRDSRGSFMFPRYLQYLLKDFRQIFVTGASRYRDELIRFWGQKVKGQGHNMTEYIPDIYISAISPVSVDRFSPNFPHWCISGQRFWGQKIKVQGHGMTECIPDFHVSTISPVSID